MRFSVEVSDREVPNLINQLIDITGAEPWRKRFAWLEREVKENNFMKDWLLERCQIEWTLNDVLRTQPMTFANPFRIESAAHYELVAFLAGVTRSFVNLSYAGRKRLTGMLLDGLKSDKGLASVQHEISTAVHLMRRGFDVEFHDLESGGGVDFVARNGRAEIEVECKMFSADLGRKIHRRRSATLFKLLEDVTVVAYKAATRGLIVRIVIPDRLTPSPSQHLNISKALSTAFVSGGSKTETNDCSIEISDFLVSDSPFAVADKEKISQSHIIRFVEMKTGRKNLSLMSFFSPGKRAVVVSLESQMKDQVLDGMRRQLRDSAVGQFTKMRPAFLAVQLHDLSGDQLLSLARSDSSWRGNASGLQIMTSDLLQSPERQHVHTIVYRSNNSVASAADISLNGDGVAYLIKNRNHPLVDDESLGIFGDSLLAGSRLV